METSVNFKELCQLLGEKDVLIFQLQKTVEEQQAALTALSQKLTEPQK